MQSDGILVLWRRVWRATNVSSLICSEKKLKQSGGSDENKNIFTGVTRTGFY